MEVCGELEDAHLLRAQFDHISADYQEKLAAATSHADQSAQSISDCTTAEATIKALRADLSAATSALANLRDEKESFLQRVAQRDRTIASDAEELILYRQNSAELPSLRQRLASAEVERDSAQLRLLQEERQRKEREEISDKSVTVLNEQILNLTTQLTKVRCDANTASAASENAVKNALEQASAAEQKVAPFRDDTARMQLFIDKLQSELNSKRAAAEELTKSFESEITDLNKIVELHEQRSQVAEQRAREFEEALTQEKELIERQGKKPQHSPGSLTPHFQVLLKNMEDALESRWHMLEKQKYEMERARESEMRMIARQEKLERGAKAARSEAEQSRKDVLRQTRMLESQGEEITKLKRQLDLSRIASPDQYLSTPTGPDRPDVRMSGSHNSGPSPGFWGSAQPQRPSNTAMDIGPETVIPTHYMPSPSGPPPADFSTSLREMSDIRKRHERLLDSLRDNRISFS